MKNQLLNILNQLELIENNAVFFKDKSLGKTFDKFNIDLQKKLEVIEPDAFYVFNNKPFILFFDLSSNKDSNKENRIQKQVWSFDNSPVIFIIKENELKIYNALNYSKQENQEGGLEEITLTPEEINDKFSFWNLQSGDTWNWLQEEYYNNRTKLDHQKRVNERLFQNIKEVREILIESDTDLNESSANSKANSLILRIIFIRYLIDRGVKIDEDYIKGKTLNQKRLSFGNLISEPLRLNELFKNLNKKFNGVLFKDIETPLTALQAKSLSDVFKGEIPMKGSLFYNQPDFYFEIFDFSIIPVEVISGIYESLISPETRKLDSAVYTPSFLVEYILEDTVQKHLDENDTSECKIFEVAVGSGIFLVQSLRRMIEKERLLNKNASKNKFNERIREITKNNIFGIDINKEALKVACFSIYIALLDYQNPKEIDKYEFPNLLGENLFEANFFDTTHQFNETIKHEVQPNYILGNPPWKKNKDAVHTNWINDNNKTIGRFELAQSFLLRTKDFMLPTTKVALIVTSTIFYNVSEKTKQFKNEFLTTFCMDKYFDLSPVRRLIFEEKNSPASIVYFKLAKNEDHLTNLVSHLSIKSNTFLKHFKTLVIEKFDQKKILQRHFIENDWMFKVALYGNTLDFNLFRKLEKSSEKTILNLIDSVSLFKGSGIERGKSTKYYPELLNLPVVENSEITQDYFKIQILNLLGEDDVHLSRGRDKNIFLGNKILFKEQCLNESEPLISFTEEDTVFRKGIFSITSKENEQIKILYALLKSDLNNYFLFLKSAAWGIATRPAIRFVDEVLSFPYKEPSDQEQNKLINLVNIYISPLKKYYKKFNLGSPQIDELIAESMNELVSNLYNISNVEQDLINYALEVSRYQFQESKQYKFLKKIDNDLGFLANYADVYINEFSNIYSDEFIQVEIYPLKHFIAMNFQMVKEKPRSNIIIPDNKFSEKEVLQILADKLSISQITSASDNSKNLYVQKDIKGFEKNSFYIIKPNEFKSWHRAMAWYDVAEFKEAIENAEINYLKNQD